MRRLVTIELRRMFTRRAVRAILVLCVFAVCAITLGLVITQGRPTDISENRWKAKRETRNERLVSCMQSDEQRYKEAPGQPNPLFADFNFSEEFIAQHEARMKRVPTRRECLGQVNALVLSRYTYSPTLGFVKQQKGFFLSGALAFVLRLLPAFGLAVGLLLGSTIGGADWSSGWVKTVLTWEARRIRVVFAKLMAVASGLTTIYLATVALVFILFAFGAAVGGSFSGFDSLMFEDYLGSIARGVGITGLAGVISCSAAFAVRYSLAGLLIPVGWVALEGVAWTLSPAGRPFSLYASVYVFGQGFDRNPLYSMPPGRAGIICLIAATFASVAAAVIFSRRDVLV